EIWDRQEQVLTFDRDRDDEWRATPAPRYRHGQVEPAHGERVAQPLGGAFIKESRGRLWYQGDHVRSVLDHAEKGLDLQRNGVEAVHAPRWPEHPKQHDREQKHDRDDGDHEQKRDLDAECVHGVASSTSTLTAS